MSSPDESVARIILSGSKPRPNPLGFSPSPRFFLSAAEEAGAEPLRFESVVFFAA